VIDRHDEPRDAAESTVGSSTQDGTIDSAGGPRSDATHLPAAIPPHGCKMSPPMEGGARPMTTQTAQSLRIEPNNPRIGCRADNRGQQSVVRSRNTCLSRDSNKSHGKYRRRSTTATCTVQREVPERPCQPEARLGRPVHNDLVRGSTILASGTASG